jgi:tetratricopeptide (TPR) repeat protein
MIRRLLTASAVTVLLLTSVAAWASPKPPDLPLQEQVPVPPMMDTEMPLTIEVVPLLPQACPVAEAPVHKGCPFGFRRPTKCVGVGNTVSAGPTCIVTVSVGVGCRAGAALLKPLPTGGVTGGGVFFIYPPAAQGEEASEPPAPKTEPKKEEPQSQCPYLRCPRENRSSVVAPDDPILKETVARQFEKLEKAEILLRRGEMLRKEGKLREAMDCFDEVIRLCPGTHCAAAAAAAKEETFDEWLESVNSGCGCIRIRLRPKATAVAWTGKQITAAMCAAQEQIEVACLLQRFNACLKEGRYHAAERAALEVLAVDSTCSAAQAALAIAHRQIEKKKAAGMKQKEHAIEETLKRPISVNYNMTPLREILNDIRDSHNINIHVDAAALEEEGISLDRPVSMKLEEVTLKSALNLMLHDVHLTWVIKDGVLVVTTEKCARGKLMTRVYAVADLLEAGEDSESVMKLITSAIAPGTWAERGGPATIDFFPMGKALVVNQTADCHEEIADLLQAVRRLHEDHRVEQSVSIEVGCLLKACYLALSEGRVEKAKQMAREAHALDQRVMAHSMVRDLLTEPSCTHFFPVMPKCEEPKSVCPAWLPTPHFGEEQRYPVRRMSWWRHHVRFSGEENCEPPSSSWPSWMPGWLWDWRDEGGDDVPLHVTLPPVDFRVPAAFDALLQGAWNRKPVLLLAIDEEQELRSEPKPEPDLEFELEVPNLDLSIPEVTGGLELPEDLVSWALGLGGVTCAEVSNCFGQWRMAVQFSMGGSVIRVRFDDGDFEMSVLPCAPVECLE